MSSPRSKKIVIFGATGVIGKVLTKALLNAKGNFESIAIFTSPETIERKKDLIAFFKSHGADVIVGDLANKDEVLKMLKGSFGFSFYFNIALFLENSHCKFSLESNSILTCTGFDTVVSAVGRSVIDKQIELIDLAEKSPSVVRFIPSEFGTDIAYNASSAEEKPHAKKIQVRSYLESDAVKRLAYTYIVTGPFADLYLGNMDSETAAGTFDVERREATLLGDGEGKIALTSMADVGRFLVAALKHPEVCDRKAIKVNSFTTTPNEALAEFERQTEATWTVKYTPLDKLRGLEAAAWQSGNPLSGLYTLRRIWTEGSTLYGEVDNEAIGMVKTDTLEMVVQDLVKATTSALQSTKL
jgi:hypothetical protein